MQVSYVFCNTNKILRHSYAKFSIWRFVWKDPCVDDPKSLASIFLISYCMSVFNIIIKPNFISSPGSTSMKICVIPANEKVNRFQEKRTSFYTYVTC